MIYSEPLLNQFRAFLLSVGFGFFVGIYYTLMRSLFTGISKGKVSVFICDIIFGAVTLVATFFFCVYQNSGRVRLFLVAGVVLGAVSFYLTLGRYIYTKLSFLISLIKKGVIILLSPLITVFRVFITGTLIRAGKCKTFVKQKAKELKFVKNKKKITPK